MPDFMKVWPIVGVSGLVLLKADNFSPVNYGVLKLD